MLIRLSPDLETHLPSLLTAGGFVDALDNLAFAHRKGIHVISGRPRLLRKIASQLSGDAAGTFKHIAGKAHEETSLLALVTDYIAVESRSTGDVQRALDGARAVFRVPYSYFTDTRRTQAARMIVEDSDDRDVYEAVLRAYVSVERETLHALSVRIEGFGGGGSSTEDQFRDHAAAGPTIAIVDSDRRHPNGKLGGTAAAVVRTGHQIETTTVSSVEILSCHELENLLPARLVPDCIIDQDGEDVRRRWLEATERGLFNGDEGVRFLDLKRGLCRWDIVACEDEQEQAYLVSSTSVCGACHREECQTPPACDKRDECKCIYLSGLGNAVVKRAATKLRPLSAQKTAEFFFADTCATRELWQALSKRLFSCDLTPNSGPLILS